jgi:hypothetical protein
VLRKLRCALPAIGMLLLFAACALAQNPRGSSTFGTTAGTDGDARDWQFTLRLTF